MWAKLKTFTKKLTNKQNVTENHNEEKFQLLWTFTVAGSLGLAYTE